MTRLGSSGVVFYLSAQAVRASSGHRRAEFTVALDGIVVTVPLTAYIGYIGQAPRLTRCQASSRVASYCPNHGRFGRSPKECELACES